MTKSQFNKFKSGIKDDAEVILNLSLNMVKVSNDETNFPQNFFLTDTRVLDFVKLLQMANIKFPKILESFNPSKILNSVDNSIKWCAEN